MLSLNKKIDVVVGCQFGSEAKGLVAGWLATKNKYDWLVSVNSAQAGHTVPYFDGEDIHYIVTRQLPSSAIINQEAKIYIGAGAIINPSVLISEIKSIEDLFGIKISERLYISKNAIIITDECIDFETEEKLTEKIGSTNEGVGAAHSLRALRKASTMRHYHPRICEELNEPFTLVSDSFPINAIGGDVLLEGSQGFGLSVFSDYYPFCTSRDTTTSAFLSYAGLSPRDLRDVYGVYRTFPIRVGGNSGSMHKELDWVDVANISGYKELAEYTTVTKRLRRIGHWDSSLAKKATIVNGVNRPVITFLNYINHEAEGIRDYNELPKETKEFLKSINSDVDGWFAASTSKEGDFIEA